MPWEVVVDPSSLATWAAVTAALTVKMHLTSLLQLMERRFHGRLRNPEDVAAFGRLGFRTVGAPVVGFGARADSVWRNDLENIPMFLLTALALLLLGASGPWYTGLLVSFAAFRVVHTAVYLAALQPWRSLIFFGSLGCQVVAIGWIVALVNDP